MYDIDNFLPLETNYKKYETNFRTGFGYKLYWLGVG